MSAKRGLGHTEYLEKKIPRNPKYQHVKSRLDTGSSLTKYMEKLEEIKRNYRYRKDELFKRLKVTTFAQLVLQVASVSELDNVESDKDLASISDSISVVSAADTEQHSVTTKGKDSPEGQQESSPVELFDSNNETEERVLSARSTLQSVITGVGEMDLERPEQKNFNHNIMNEMDVNIPYPDCPYLLLDVREKDHYDQCHIIGAYSYPIATLSRTMNPYTKDILEYKNASGKIIIVYDEDERIASQAATTMCERGFENLFMLSGGLKVISQKFPEGLTTGSFPESLQEFSPTATRKRSTPRQPSYPAENKWRFTTDDLNKIHLRFDEILIPTDANSRYSRLTKSSSARSSRASSVTSSDSGFSKSSRPWK
ncbi:centrosomal protein of 41 kDa [Erpetoichthys calabaricus]|uniref:Centrosomal protein 41 n=1 Tax=Erpetoichthys calabaricus TaxID=27687 RepID=A0A8C4SGK3_ERPCA|nr:centrosomal protein of 41 kDa [Erpetoichthys calabaricus]